MIKNRKNKFYSVSYKLIVQITAFSVFICSALGASAFSQSKSTMKNYLKEVIGYYVLSESNSLSLDIREIAADIEKIAADDRMKSMDFAIQQPLMMEKIKNNGYSGMSVCDANGNVNAFNGQTVDVSSNSSLLEVLNENILVGDPKEDNKLGESRSSMPVSVPIYNNEGKIVGRLTGNFDTDFLSESLNDSKIGESGVTFLLNLEGDVIVTNDTDIDFAVSPQNIFEYYSERENLAVIYRNILENIEEESKGAFEYIENGIPMYGGYSKIEGTNWIMFSIIPKMNASGGLFDLAGVIAKVTACAIVISTIVAIWIGRSIKKPLSEVEKFAKALSEKDLTYKINIKSRDEFGVVGNMLNDAMSHLRDVVFSVKEAEDMTRDLIKITDEKVISITNNVQNVASGTQEISSSVEESAASIEEISNQVANVKVFAGEIDEQSRGNTIVANDIRNVAKEILKDSEISKNKILEEYEQSKRKLDEALKKVEVIREIATMAENINSIASQTNMLSLNASIEAAKAGESGRGFGVVAEEVRKLAEEASETAKNIKTVMNNVIDSVRELTTASREILDSMKENMDDNYKKIFEISTEYNNSGETISNMTSSLESQVSKIVLSLNDIVENVSQLSGVMEVVSENADRIAADSTSITFEMKELSESSSENIKVSSELSEVMNAFNVEE